MIYIASDHAGFKLKENLKKFLVKKYKIEDLGPYKYDKNDDYPDYAVKVAKRIAKNKNNRGILICATGQGMDRVANKIPGIHAAVCWNKISAKYAKEHGNVNVLCFGEKIVNPQLTEKMVKIWLETPFKLKKKHIRRINKIKKIERKYFKKKPK